MDGKQTLETLQNQAVFHALAKVDIFDELEIHNSINMTSSINVTESAEFLAQPKDPTTCKKVYTFSDRYSSGIFQGIMIDTGAAGASTVGEAQLKAYQELNPSVTVNTKRAGEQRISFADNPPKSSLGTVLIPTPFGTMTFHVLPANTPFLMCLNDLDLFKLKFDNLQNTLEQCDGGNVPKQLIVRKFGHPWLLLDDMEHSVAHSHLTEVELKQLHRRFGHPSVGRLLKLLLNAGHEVDSKILEKLTKFCHHCQLNAKSPGRFKFTIRDEDMNFNYSIQVDVMYLDGKPVLHVVDQATAFQAGKFLPSMSAKHAWDTLRLCWIDAYQGPPDYIVSDSGTNFASKEFALQAGLLSSQVKIVPVEAHNSIGKVERYHGPIQRVYRILQHELEGSDTSDEVLLQMTFKAINDTAGPDAIVPTLLVFGAYPRMTKDSAPSPTLAQRADAIRKAQAMLTKYYADRKINDALAMRNGPNTTATMELPINSDVKVWREAGKWSGPHRLISLEGTECVVDMPHGYSRFRITAVKPYWREDGTIAPNLAEEVPDFPDGGLLHYVPKRKRGRPKGSKNFTKRPKSAGETLQTETADETPQYAATVEDAEEDELDDDNEERFIQQCFTIFCENEVFISSKEASDMALVIKLRAEGAITTPGPPFELSDNAEIDGLLGNGVFRFEQFDPVKHEGIRIFNSRLVNEVKDKQTLHPYEKSRLVIQGYDDQGKKFILTQAPTIQRSSQRIILALAPTFLSGRMSNEKFKLYLRDITQAYTQSQSELARDVWAYLPLKIRHLHPPGTIMRVVKPLYGIAEAGTHWFKTYSDHHLDKLEMTTSTFDPCLLISKTTDAFGIVGMQTDDTLILGNDLFSQNEEDELNKANFKAKPKTELTADNELQFNGCILTWRDDVLRLRQKGQGRKLTPIDLTSEPKTLKDDYIQQRARGAYISSICQPEAAFALSVAAQLQQPAVEHATTLNTCLNWMIANQDRGIDYIPLDLSTAKIFVFCDGSFANNKDLTSQLGFVIVIANETTGENSTFNIKGNLIHFSSVKSNRVTRSTLASEVLATVASLDASYVEVCTINMILRNRGLEPLPVIVCTDSFSLYECIVKLGTTKEKRLMIDIQAIRQSYERREVYEVRWIDGQDNPSDAMTKAKPNRALERLISTNTLDVRVEGHVIREG